MDTDWGESLLLFCIALLLTVLLLVAVDIRDTIKEHYSSTPLGVEEIVVLEYTNKEMFELFKARCKEKHGSDYVHRYMSCTGELMEIYLEKT